MYGDRDGILQVRVAASVVGPSDVDASELGRIQAASEAAARDAAARWSPVPLAPAVFEAYVRERLSDDAPLHDLSSLHVADLYLACACVHGDAAAWRELDRAYLSQIASYIARVDSSRAFADEVRQVLAERLLPAASDPPRLARYSGRGPLGAWMRVAAVRVARDLKRAVRPADPLDETTTPVDPGDVEVAFLKRQFAGEFESAFQAVLRSLAVDERNILRLHYLDGLSIEEVGRTYGVSRATAARSLASARATIIERVRAALAARIAPSVAGPGSVLAFVQSQLDLSIRRLLT